MTTPTCPTCHAPLDGSGCTDLRALPWDGPAPCRDCAVIPGGQHHEGCVLAVCLRCGDQLYFGCVCADALVN